MPIPVRCFTCGNVLANKYRFFASEVDKRCQTNNPLSTTKPFYLTVDMLDKPLQKSVAGVVMDEMKITQPCCRRHMISHVEIE